MKKKFTTKSLRAFPFSDDNPTPEEKLFKCTLNEWYNAKHRTISDEEVKFINSVNINKCPYCCSTSFIKNGHRKDGIQKYGENKENLGDKEIIVFMHYPPITKAKVISQQEAEFVELMKKYNVKRCYYGHLHGASIGDAIEGDVQGIEFKLVSADGLKFKLLKI